MLDIHRRHRRDIQVFPQCIWLLQWLTGEEVRRGTVRPLPDIFHEEFFAKREKRGKEKKGKNGDEKENCKREEKLKMEGEENIKTN